MKTVEASGELFSTIHMQIEQWRMQKMKGKENEEEKDEEEQWLAVKMVEAGGELRELLSTVLCLCSSRCLFLLFRCLCKILCL